MSDVPNTLFQEPFVAGPLMAFVDSKQVRKRLFFRGLWLGTTLSIFFSFAIYFATKNHGYETGATVFATWFLGGMALAIVEFMFRSTGIKFEQQILYVTGYAYHRKPEVVDSAEPVITSLTRSGLIRLALPLEKENALVFLSKKDGNALSRLLRESAYMVETEISEK